MTSKRWLWLLLVTAPAWAQDEALAPDGTSASDNSTTCNGTVHPTVDDDPDSPGGDWCIADNNNTSWAFTLTFPTPSSTLDNTTDAQVFEFYVRSFDEGQSGDPTIRVDIHDGTGCADLHESGAETTLTDAGFPAKVSEAWTSAGISAAADICAVVTCTKTGGSPSSRNSCDIDAIEWDVAWAAVASRSRAHVIGGN